MHLDPLEEVGTSIKIDTGEMVLNSHLVIASKCTPDELETETKHYAILGGVLKNKGIDLFLVVRKNKSDYTVGLLFKTLTEQTIKILNTTAFSEKFNIDHARILKVIRVRLTGKQALGIEKLPEQDGGKKLKFNRLKTTFFFKEDLTEIELANHPQPWSCYDLGKEDIVKTTPCAFIIDEDIVVAHSNKLCTRFIVHYCAFSKDKSVLAEIIDTIEEVSMLPIKLQQSFAHFEKKSKEVV